MNSRTHNRLYFVVYGAWYAKAAVLLLLLSQLLQPATLALAAEETASSTTEATSESTVEAAVAESVNDVPEETIETEFVDDNSSTVEENSMEGEFETVTEPDLDTTDASQATTSETLPPVESSNTPAAPASTSTPVFASSTPIHSPPEPPLETATSTATSSMPTSSPPATSSTSTTNDLTAPEPAAQPAADITEPTVSENEPDATVPETNQTISEPEPTPEATSTTPSVPLPTMAVSDVNRYQFAKNDCVPVGDGSYYCSEKAIIEDQSVESGVFAAPDSGGDKEIWITVNEETRQLTSNELDDGAPYYDSLSGTVVWHQLSDGQYDVFASDVETGTETRLTSSSENDMEPTRAGSVTVWQRWIEGNWEIMLNDGETTTRITSTSEHDISPQVRGAYVLWHRIGNGTQQAIVYELETGLTSVIRDETGGAVSNPRFVLVYDTTYENGDIVTKGYDFETGAVVPLAALPAELPDDMPEPESTGETRALLQNKTGNNEDELFEQPTGSSNPPLPNSSSTSSTATSSPVSEMPTAQATSSNGTLDLRSGETIGADIIEPATEFDLVVPPYTASSTQSGGSDSATSSLE